MEIIIVRVVVLLVQYNLFSYRITLGAGDNDTSQFLRNDV